MGSDYGSEVMDSNNGSEGKTLRRRGARVLKGSKCPLMAKDERWSVVGHVVFLWANAPSNSEIPGFSTDKII
ncbi:hypothetical protein Ahy_A09g043049 isoform C [Arachis hypogaea]|uniref:Uncharacterized protein n=1 Tax=Arachis hypogaea TaxID=3818 RepID=A0A445BHJ6_ARAHY|nr:hypothetical protein Ahy_A09g043049 isoform C [Arachis hypogaea]